MIFVFREFCLFGYTRKEKVKTYWQAWQMLINDSKLIFSFCGFKIYKIVE